MSLKLLLNVSVCLCVCVSVLIMCSVYVRWHVLFVAVQTASPCGLSVASPVRLILVFFFFMMHFLTDVTYTKRNTVINKTEYKN